MSDMSDSSFWDRPESDVLKDLKNDIKSGQKPEQIFNGVALMYAAEKDYLKATKELLKVMPLTGNNAESIVKSAVVGSAKTNTNNVFKYFQTVPKVKRFITDDLLQRLMSVTMINKANIVHELYQQGIKPTKNDFNQALIIDNIMGVSFIINNFPRLKPSVNQVKSLILRNNWSILTLLFKNDKFDPSIENNFMLRNAISNADGVVLEKLLKDQRVEIGQVAVQAFENLEFLLMRGIDNSTKAKYRKIIAMLINDGRILGQIDRSKLKEISNLANLNLDTLYFISGLNNKDTLSRIFNIYLF